MIAAKTMGATIPTPLSTDCWKPIAAPLRAGPASSAAAVNASAFQPMESPPASASTGTSSQAPTRERGGRGQPHGDDDAHLPERPDPLADDVGPPPRPDPEPDGQHLRCRDHERRVAFAEPVLVGRNTTPKPTTAIWEYT